MIDGKPDLYQIGRETLIGLLKENWQGIGAGGLCRAGSSGLDDADSGRGVYWDVYIDLKNNPKHSLLCCTFLKEISECCSKCGHR
jgi:hypothetical protein